MKGQVSVEMLLVVGLGVAVVGVYMIYAYSSLDAYQKGNDEFLVKDSLQKVAETAKFVSFQGYPARQEINICFPLSYTNCSVSNSSITCGLRSGENITQDVDANITGAMPENSGCWDMMVQAGQNFVNITVS